MNCARSGTESGVSWILIEKQKLSTDAYEIIANQLSPK